MHGVYATNRVVMEDLMYRIRFGLPVEVQSRAVLRALSLQMNFASAVTTADFTAAVAIFLNCSRPAADRAIAEAEEARLIVSRPSETDGRVKHYYFAPGVGEKYEAMEDDLEEINAAIREQKKYPNKLDAGIERLSNKHIYFNVRNPGEKETYLANIAEKVKEFREERKMKGRQMNGSENKTASNRLNGVVTLLVFVAALLAALAYHGGAKADTAAAFKRATQTMPPGPQQQVRLIEGLTQVASLAAMQNILGGNASLTSTASWADDLKSAEAGLRTQPWHFAIANAHDYVPSDCGATGSLAPATQPQVKTVGTVSKPATDRRRAWQLFVSQATQWFHRSEHNGDGGADSIEIDFPGAMPSVKAGPIPEISLYAIWDLL